MLRAGSSISLAARELLPGRTPPEWLAALQRAKLRRLVMHAYAHVPFYRDLYRAHGLADRDLHEEEVLQQLPIVTKQLLREAGSARVSGQYASARLTEERTSGSSGEPFSMLFDREYVVAKNFRFLRGLFAAGYRPGNKLLSISEHAGERRGSLPRWRYAALDATPAQHAEDVCRFEPDVLYGPMTPLRLLAEHLERERMRFRPPARLISTGEMLEDATRRRLEGVFRTSAVDFYGLTETGLCAWKLAAERPYVFANEGVIVERIAMPGHANRYRLVITNLDLRAMPVIRYDTGDIGVFAAADDSPPDLLRIEGRSVDCIIGTDGRSWSPFQLTVALQDVPGVERFRIRQTTLENLEVEVQSTRRDVRTLTMQTLSALEQVLGKRFRIEVLLRERLHEHGGRKFRVVESLVQPPLEP